MKHDLVSPRVQRTAYCCHPRSVIQRHALSLRVVAVPTALLAVNFLLGCGADDAATPTESVKTSTPQSSATDVVGAASVAPSAAASGTAFPGSSSTAELDSQLPPTNADEMGRWLKAGYYQDWVCESKATSKTDGAAAIHVHGAKSRVCSNVLLAATPAPEKGKEFPKGVAAVKEVYDAADQLLGLFVEVKTATQSDKGDGWYWYKDADVIADGFGFAGCSGCHSASGSDADHPGAGDYVYFQQTDPTQIPIIGDTESVSQWLEMKYYNDWDCEKDATEKTDGAAGTHVHGINRVCSNRRLADKVPANGKWGAGVAAVKEIFNSEGKVSLTALYLKVSQESAGGAGWYWYEGASNQGFGASACVGCHGAAGSDSEHPGLDYVYFPSGKQ